MICKDLAPVIECSGSPFEIGKAHGVQAKPQIDITIATYKAMFKDYSGIDWAKAKVYARTFIPAITAYDPDIMEEIRGVAEGSGYDLEDILALNVRSEIVMQGAQVNAMDGCTSFAFTPDWTATGETYIGQNWDWKQTQQKAVVILHIKQASPTKPDITVATEAGIVGKIGYNSAGIGVCLNALGSDKVVQGQVLPLHIALRGVLNSVTLSDAIRASGTMNLSCCANFTMASASGQAVCMEIGPGDVDVIYAEDGYCAHTNHFYAPRLAHVRDTGRIAFPDTYLRLGRVRVYVKKLDGKVSIGDLKNMLRDHVGHPDSICRHEDCLEPAEKRMCTLFSIIMVLDRGEMYFAPGSPCTYDYQLYKF